MKPSAERRSRALRLAAVRAGELGRWRTQELGQPVNASAVLHDGVTFNGPVGLRTQLLQHQDTFFTGLTEKLLTYSMGGQDALSHPTEAQLMPSVRRILRETDAADRRWSTLIAAIVGNTPAH